MLKHIIGYTFIASIAVYTINLQEQKITSLEHNNSSLAAQLSICNAEYDDANEIIAHQQLVIKLMEDGASYKEAEDIITVSEEVGISPKY